MMVLAVEELAYFEHVIYSFTENSLNEVTNATRLFPL